MCGRAAQTYNAVQVAAQVLGASGRHQPAGGGGGMSTSSGNSSAAPRRALDAASLEQHEPHEGNSSSVAAAAAASSSSSSTSEQQQQQQQQTDNYNMSPGMDAVVFWFDHSTRTVQMGRKVWGLVTQRGTASCPLPTGMSQHFSNFMFNARSDTLYQKPTFARLATSGKTCLIAVDGFFEWKAEVKGKKQPYFVYRRRRSKNASSSSLPTATDSRPYLLMAGLWTSVPTGRSRPDDDPVLDTFTILTTDACPSLQWLHTRMPVCIWNDTLALEWLRQPSSAVHRRLDEEACQTPDGMLQWHAVTPEMSSMKFRTKDAIKALPKMKTVTSFFRSTGAVVATAAAAAKKSSPIASSTKDNNNAKEGDSTKKKGDSSTPVSLDGDSNSKNNSKRPPTTATLSNASPSPSKSAKLAAKSTPKKGTLFDFFSPKDPKK